ncbi:MAG: hypothetical protein Q4G03_05100 [Planctomycetia bacterium]|nr:hypothetical protein [Planctomycetia bacterium]
MTPPQQPTQRTRNKVVTATGRLALLCLTCVTIVSNTALAQRPTDAGWRWQTERTSATSTDAQEEEVVDAFLEPGLVSGQDDASESRALELYDANSAQGSEKTTFFTMLGKCRQGSDLTLEYLPTQDESGYFGVNASMKLGLPSAFSGHFILVSPTLGYRRLDVPTMGQIANDKIELYSLGGGVSYVIPHSERWLYTLSVNGAYNGDGSAKDKESVNISTVALAIFTPSEEWKWFLGGCYATTAETKLLPILGAVWTPSEQWRVDFLFPEPKVAKKVELFNHNPEESYWLSVGGGMSSFNGVFESIPPAWQGATRRDVKTEYRDFRVFTELERQATQFQYRCQLGMAFARKIKLESRQGAYWFETNRPGAAVYFKTIIHF